MARLCFSDAHMGNGLLTNTHISGWMQDIGKELVSLDLMSPALAAHTDFASENTHINSGGVSFNPNGLVDGITYNFYPAQSDPRLVRITQGRAAERCGALPVFNSVNKALNGIDGLAFDSYLAFGQKRFDGPVFYKSYFTVTPNDATGAFDKLAAVIAGTDGTPFSKPTGSLLQSLEQHSKCDAFGINVYDGESEIKIYLVDYSGFDTVWLADTLRYPEISGVSDTECQRFHDLDRRFNDVGFYAVGLLPDFHTDTTQTRIYYFKDDGIQPQELTGLLTDLARPEYRDRITTMLGTLEAASMRVWHLRIAPTLRGSSLGGVLSVGGISAESASKGILAQFVKRMTVITENGEQMSCSADQDSEQFYRTLCGAGQAGLIWDVDIAIEPKPATHAIFRNTEPLPLDRLDGILDFFLKRDDNLPEGCIVRLDKTAQQIENIHLIYNSNQPKAERQNILIGTDIIPLDRKVPNFRAQDDVEYYGRDDFFMIPCVVYAGRRNLARIIELAQDAAGFMAAHDLDYYQNIDVVKSAPLDRSRPHWPNHNDEPFTTSLELVAMVHKSQRALADQLHDKLLAFTRAAAAHGGRPYRTTWHDEAIYDTPAKTA